MIIIKFALVAFLIGMTLLLALRPRQGVPVGGPHFYLAMPGSRNPIRPSARINAYQATKRRHVWRVWFDSSGDPVKWRLYDNKVPVYEETLMWRKPGELLARRRTL
jgi:hypothetical protein